MYQLYYSPGTCSLAPHVVLNELGVKYELKKTSLPDGDNRKPEFLAINPRGQVPVLVDSSMPEGERNIWEGAAILLHLFDKHPSPLLPKEHRTLAVQWLMFANSTLHPAYGRMFGLKKMGIEESNPVYKAGIENINSLWAHVEKRLQDQPFVCGKEPTVADILISVIANWSGNFPTLAPLGPNTKRMLKAVTARPAYLQALKDEQVEYKAAA